MSIRRAAWATLGLLAGLPGLAPAPAVAAPAVAAPVVLIGTGGLGWSDVGPDTPALLGLATDGAAGWLAARSVRAPTCPVDGWLAVSTGRRTADVPGPCRTPLLSVARPGGTAEVPRWAEYRRAAAAEKYDAEPGLLGDDLARAGVRSAAVGPGAAIALARTGGSVEHAWAGGASLASDVRAAVAGGPAVLAVDVGQVEAGAGHATALKTVEARLGSVLAELPTGSTVVVASLADAGRKAQLQLVAATGPQVGGGAYADGLLGSRSTRQDGLAQATDLLPTLLAAAGLNVPASVVGSPLHTTTTGGTAAQRLDRLVDFDVAARANSRLVPSFFTLWLVVQLTLYAAATVVVRRTRAGPAPARAWAWLPRAAVLVAAVPVSTFLANLLPWWRFSSPPLAVTGAVLLFAVPIAAVALLGPWRASFLGPAGVVGGVTFAVLGIDAVTGSHLMLSSLMGLQPVVAGRFYGFGNGAFALFATGALLLALAVADPLLRNGRRAVAVAVVAGLGLVTVVVDGTPGLGSDFGGPPALIPGFTVATLLLAGLRITWRRALTITGVTLLAIVLICFGDWLRPPADRTHLGRFFQTVLDGGFFGVVGRKAGQNLRILFTSWLSALLVVAVAFVTLVLGRTAGDRRPLLREALDRSPALRPGITGFVVLLVIGFALNDSGSVVPALAMSLAVPLLISACANLRSAPPRR